MKFSNNNNYEGYWENGEMHGFGIFQWPDKKLYLGEY
jgi:hypothetical protein